MIAVHMLTGLQQSHRTYHICSGERGRSSFSRTPSSPVGEPCPCRDHPYQLHYCSPPDCGAGEQVCTSIRSQRRGSIPENAGPTDRCVEGIAALNRSRSVVIQPFYFSLVSALVISYCNPSTSVRRSERRNHLSLRHFYFSGHWFYFRERRLRN